MRGSRRSNNKEASESVSFAVRIESRHEFLLTYRSAALRDFLDADGSISSVEQLLYRNPNNN